MEQRNRITTRFLCHPFVFRCSSHVCIDMKTFNQCVKIAKEERKKKTSLWTEIHLGSRLESNGNENNKVIEKRRRRKFTGRWTISTQACQFAFQGIDEERKKNDDDDDDDREMTNIVLIRSISFFTHCATHSCWQLIVSHVLCDRFRIDEFDKLLRFSWQPTANDSPCS